MFSPRAGEAQFCIRRELLRQRVAHRFDHAGKRRTRLCRGGCRRRSGLYLLGLARVVLDSSRGGGRR